ncbi:hypothetical protein HPB47_018303 [Ixodes persulcatus]|uniref:Uncharacterized protein n=1 Tax=Ixodes persulcatus TaxID=34615 RepID=A0AC60QPP8_IXOPE|nr:hypothetical protein HPB47_018303 [Ixodes persulcatus]
MKILTTTSSSMMTENMLVPVPPAPAWTFRSRQRDSKVFAGPRDGDVEGWIDSYERTESTQSINTITSEVPEDSTENSMEVNESEGESRGESKSCEGPDYEARRGNNNDKSYAQATKKPKGYYADDDDEVEAWQAELRAIDARNRADIDKCRRLETELLQLRQKIEEERRRREARRSTILGHIKTAMEARKAQQEQQRKQREAKNITIDTSQWCTELQEVVALRIALQSTSKRLTVASAYNRPQTTKDFSWIRHLRKEYSDDFMVLGGDLNTHVEHWAIGDTVKGAADLRDITEQADVTLINDFSRATRYATGAGKRDSIIDVTMAPASTARKLQWSIFNDASGSDHFPIAMELDIGAKNRQGKKQTKTIIWDDFRKNTEEQGEDFKFQHVATLLTTAARIAIDERKVDGDSPTPDTHLLSLWDRRTAALTTYRKKKLRKHLIRVNKLTKEASQYASQLGYSQTWETYGRLSTLCTVKRRESVPFP